MIARFVIEVSSHAVKKNGRPIYRNADRVFLGKSYKLKIAESSMILEMRNQFWRSSDGPVKAIDYPVNVMMLFYFNKDHYYTKKGSINKKIPDLSNLYQLPEDCLEKAGVIDNDHLIYGHDGSRRLPTEGSSYLEIIITKM